MRKVKAPVLLKAGAFGLFIIVAAIIAVAFVTRRHNNEPQRPSNGQPSLGGNLQTVVSDFKEMHSEGGKNLFLLTAAKDQTFDDGHHNLEGVRLEFFGKNGDKSDVITSDHAVYDNAKAFADFNDNVNVNLSDGSIIKTNSAHYDQAKKIVTSDDVVQFERQGISGSFKGLFFDSGATRLQMKSNVNIRMIPKEHPGGAESGPVTIKAGYGEYEKAAAQMVFTGKVNVERGTDQMDADKMTAFLNAQNKISRLEARGDSYMKMSQPGKAFELKSRDLDFDFDDQQQLQGAVASGGVSASSVDQEPKRSFTSDKMEMTFAPGQQGSQIKKISTDGRTTIFFGAPAKGKNPSESEIVANKVLVDFRDNSKDLSHAEAIGDALLTITPTIKDAKADRKRIHAGKFTVDFYDSDNIVRQCNGDGGVKVEMEPLQGNRPMRTTTSQTMVANFDRASQELVDLTQEGSFKYVEGERNATAKRATFTQADNTIRLTGDDPSVWDSAARTQAEEITINTQSGKGEAHRRVRTTYYNKEKTGGAAPFANTRSPVFVTANNVEIENNGDSVVYTGAARAWQDQNFVAADRISLAKEDKQMIADGHVNSALSQVKKSQKGTKENVPVFAKAAKMSFNDTSRRIHYEGGVDVKQGTDTLKSQTLDIFLKNGSNEVDHIVAETGVSMTQPGRRGSGDKAEYNAEADTIVLTGNLAKIEDDQRGLTTGRQLTLNMSDDKILIEDQRGTRRGHAVHKSQ